MTKEELRKKHLTLREGASPLLLLYSANAICKALKRLDAYRRAETVLVYLSARREVDTVFLAKAMLRDGKRVCAPKCDPATNGFEARQICNLESDVQPGAFGILEPVTDQLVPRAEVDLVIVPAVAYGRNKHRIGRGKGYYDRYLQGLSALKVGFCFSFNLEEAVPFEAHDVPVDVIITDTEIIE